LLGGNTIFSAPRQTGATSSARFLGTAPPPKNGLGFNSPLLDPRLNMTEAVAASFRLFLSRVFPAEKSDKKSGSHKKAQKHKSSLDRFCGFVPFCGRKGT